MDTINLVEKFSLISDRWSPKIIAELNGQAVKLAKVSGTFVWHDHAAEDELFLVVRGSLLIDIEGGGTLSLAEGELCVVPRGITHRPRTPDGEETWILLLEPTTTRHSGTVRHELTRDSCDRI
jgi:mannose-6-phosphate isomerase-like protein (cupin superfamily)